MTLSNTSRSELTQFGAAELAGQIAEGEISAAEVVDAHIRRIEEVDGRLNAVVVPRFEQAREEAAAADAARARGEPLGPLHGVPVTIKECFYLEGTDATIGVDALVGDPAVADSPLVRRLRSAGAIVLGKTNVQQLMLAHETDNPVFGQTNNPWDLERTPGGSSGGEAAVIAAAGSPLGLGSDIGGSIRQPAHSCGICGLKPTSGRLTTAGCRTIFAGMRAIPVEPGPMARTVQDLALAMQVLVSEEGATATAGVPPLGWRDPADVRLEGLRVGVWSEDGYFRPSPAIRRAVDEAAAALGEAHVSVERFDPPDITEMMRIYLGVLCADGMDGLRQLVAGSRIDWRIKRFLHMGRIPRWLRPALAAAMRVGGQLPTAELVCSTGRLSTREFWRLNVELDNYVAAFFSRMKRAGLDAVIFPPHALPALTHGSTPDLLPAGSYCFLANLLGMPAGVVPATRVRYGEESDRPDSRDWAEREARRVERASAGLPVGVQVAAPPWREDVVLAVMQALENHFSRQPDFPHAPPV